MNIRNRILISLVCFGQFILVPSNANSKECAFKPWFKFKGTQIYRHSETGAYFYETDHAAVDADGAPDAYHPSDVGKRCQRDKHIGLDCPDNAGYPNSSWWQSVLVVDPQNKSKAYVQRDGEYKGFFVSKTWLQDSSRSALDPRRYVNSRRVPYLVFPGSKFSKIDGTGYKGDVGYAVHLGNSKTTSFIVADQGGGSEAKLGEASVAFFEALGGSNVDPRNGRGVARGKVRYVIFPNSRKAANQIWPRRYEDIEAQVQKLLQTVGGLKSIDACSD